MLQIPTRLKSEPEALNSPAAIKAYDDFAAAAARPGHQSESGNCRRNWQPARACWQGPNRPRSELGDGEHYHV